MKSAFTLIELLVTVAIIGVLSAVLIPGMQGPRENLLAQEVATQLADVLREAQTRSQAEQIVYGVTIAPATNQVDLMQYPEGSSSSVISSIALDSRLTIDPTTLSDVRFSAAGWPTVSGTVVVHASNAAQTSWRVEVKPAGIITVNPI